MNILLFYRETCSPECNKKAQFSRVTRFSQVVCLQFLIEIFRAQSKQSVFL